MSAKPAIIFDLDGVIIHSEPHWVRVSSEFLQRVIPRWTADDQKRILGKSARDVYLLLCSEYGLAMSWEEYVGSYEQLAGEIYGKLSEPVTGALELLAFLDQSHYELAIASSAPRAWIDVVLKRFYIERRFRAVVGAEDVAGRIKPAPDPYLAAAALLSRRPEDCIAIDDSGKGVQSAIAAGMRVVGLALSERKKGELSAAGIVLTSLEEIPVRSFEKWVLALPKPPLLR